VLWVVFYPLIYAIHDEAAYMSQAYVMRTGTIFGDVAGINVVSSVETRGGHLVTKYAPGASFLLIPFTFFGWKTIFLLPLILHLLGFFVFIKILRIYNISPYFSLFYLLYPASVLYSRTIMSDLPSAVFFTIALYFFLRGRKLHFLSGFFFGVLLLFRYSNVILLMPFFVYLVVDLFKKWQKNYFLKSSFFRVSICFFPGFLVFLLYNKFAFGGFLRTSYYIAGMFSLHFFARNLLFYSLSLSLMFPLMLFSIFSHKRDKFVLTSVVVLFALFYSLISSLAVAPGRRLAETLVVGMRYLLPVIPIFILSYSVCLERIKEKRPILGNLFFWFVVGMFFIFDVIMVYKHQGFLKQQEEYKNTIYNNTEEKSLVLTNYDGMEFFQPVWGKRQIGMFVYWKDRVPIDFSKCDFNKLYLLTVIRSDKEGNEYVNKYADEIIKEYNGETVAEIKGDPELRLWKLHYESETGKTEYR